MKRGFDIHFLLLAFSVGDGPASCANQVQLQERAAVASGFTLYFAPCLQHIPPLTALLARFRHPSLDGRIIFTLYVVSVCLRPTSSCRDDTLPKRDLWGGLLPIPLFRSCLNQREGEIDVIVLCRYIASAAPPLYLHSIHLKNPTTQE